MAKLNKYSIFQNPDSYINYNTFEDPNQLWKKLSMKNKQDKLGFLWISLLFVSSILIVLFLAPIDNNSFVKEGDFSFDIGSNLGSQN